LKSVYLEIHADLVKLVFHSCHLNDLNVHQQVGIVAINLIGNSVGDLKTAPTSNQAPMTDLAYDVYIDEFTSKYIHLFTIRKEQAIVDEDYILAKKLKSVLDFLAVEYKEIAKLQISKKRAIENDDFDTAQILKLEIREKRKDIEKGVFDLGFSVNQNGAVISRGVI
jgi:centrosomal protein CEP104